MTDQEAIKEAEAQIDMYESFILYNKDFEPENDNSNYENKIDFLKTVIKALKKQEEIDYLIYRIETAREPFEYLHREGVLRLLYSLRVKED